MSGKGAVGLDECMPEILDMMKEDVLDGPEFGRWLDL